MRPGLPASLLAGSVLLLSFARVSPAAVITGTVIGEGARPVAGATVQVVGAQPPCATTTVTDGTFSLPCAASGRYVVRASFADLQPWEVADIELGASHEIHLNFMLLPAAGLPPADVLSSPPANAMGFWSRPLPNPVLATWSGRPITLRILAIVVGALSFVLGALTMLVLGRRFGIETHRLSADEVGDMILNPNLPAVGERVTPIAVAGARGAAANVSYGADEIASALAAGRYGLVLVALVVAPGCFALFALMLATATMVGQETYLFCALLLVPAGFVLTAVMIGIQALARRRQSERPAAG